MAIATEVPARIERIGARAAKLDVARLIGASFRVYFHRWRPHLAASIIAQAPILVPTLVVIEHLVDAMADAATASSAESVTPAVGLSVLLLLLAFVSAFFFVLMSGAACQLVDLWLNERDVALLGAYRVALARFWRLAGAMLAVFAATCLGLAALVGLLALVYFSSLAALQVDGSEAANDPRVVWLMLALLVLAAVASTAFLMDALVRWAVFVQAVIVEDAGPVAALARSAALVRGKWRSTAWAMILLMVVPLLLMMALGAVLSLVLAPLVSAGVVSSGFVNHSVLIAAQLALSPVAPIGVTVLFYALRDGDAAWKRIHSRLAR